MAVCPVRFYKLYLQEMKSVREKIEDFEKSGKINILRLF